MDSSDSSQVDTNWRTYERPATVEWLRTREGWLDPAERILVNRVADEVRGLPILDLGVGTGRTAWMLRPISPGYVGIDYSPEMVDACRREYPGLDVRACDARDLSMFGDETFALVMFSFLGIDSLDREGRLRVLSEAFRVLRPGGLFLYSTQNKNGILYGRRPWEMVWHKSLRSTAKFIALLPSSLPRYRRTYRNWWQHRGDTQDHGAWAIRTAVAHEFSLVLHWTLPTTERRALESQGFAVEAIVDQDGDVVESDAGTSFYFYLLARKSRPATPSG